MDQVVDVYVFCAGKVTAMRETETAGTFDEIGALKFDGPMKLKNRRVKIIVLIPEEDEMNDLNWLAPISSNPAFDFLNDQAEDIYSVNDGEAIGKAFA